MRPDLEVTLLEPLLRRSAFLAEVLETLHLRSVRVVRSRAEDHGDQYDVVTSRALAPLPRLLGWCNPLRSPGGAILALKGQAASEEVRAAGPELAKERLRAEVLTVRAFLEAETATVIRATSA